MVKTFCARCGEAVNLPTMGLDCVTATMKCKSCWAELSVIMCMNSEQELLQTICESDTESDVRRVVEAKNAEEQIWDSIMARAPAVPAVLVMLRAMKEDRMRKFEEEVNHTGNLAIESWGMNMDVTVHCHICGSKVSDVLVAQMTDAHADRVVPKHKWCGPVVHTCRAKSKTAVTFQRVAERKVQLIMVSAFEKARDNI